MKLHRQTGSVSLIFMLGIFCVAIGYGVYFFLGGSSSHSDENQQEIFDSYKKSVQNAMQNPHTIDISVKRNPNPFRCLYEQNANCSGAGGDFLLFEDDQKPALSQIVYGTGLNKNGFGCKNFPSQECSYRIETVWVPICQGNYCENTSSFHVKVKLVYDQNLPGTSPQT